MQSAFCFTDRLEVLVQLFLVAAAQSTLHPVGLFHDNIQHALAIFQPLYTMGHLLCGAFDK